ncbi:DUF3486 family protein [Solimonas flava]|uniref:DUF3486 family protein n=1 Tax=Solimonas flava TaxID=415849 RepID=UPI0003F8B210|nr:DUF3486 family protein [Solimonas flava]
MPRKSSIRAQDKDVRKLIDELLGDGGYTLDEIRAELRTRFPKIKPPSRSALGRYSQSVEKIGERLRQSRAVASVWAEQLGREPEGDIGKIVMELLRTLAFDATEGLANSVGTLDEDGNPVKLDPKIISTLSLAMQRLEAAGKWSLEREKKLREAVLAEAEKNVEKKLAAGPRKLDAEALKLVREAIRGEA